MTHSVWLLQFMLVVFTYWSALFQSIIATLFLSVFEALAPVKLSILEPFMLSQKMFIILVILLQILRYKWEIIKTAILMCNSFC